MNETPSRKPQVPKDYRIRGVVPPVGTLLVTVSPGMGPVEWARVLEPDSAEFLRPVGGPGQAFVAGRKSFVWTVSDEGKSWWWADESDATVAKLTPGEMAIWAASYVRWFGSIGAVHAAKEACEAVLIFRGLAIGCERSINGEQRAMVNDMLGLDR